MHVFMEKTITAPPTPSFFFFFFKPSVPVFMLGRVVDVIDSEFLGELGGCSFLFGFDWN